MKRIFALTITIFMIICLTTGCKKTLGSPEDIAGAALAEKEQGQEEEKEPYLFGFSGMSMENPYFIILEQSIRDAVENEGYQMITEDPSNNPSLQSTQLQDMIRKGVKTVFLTPVDWELISPVLKQMKDAGITIINIDSQVKEMEYVDAYIGSDNIEAGKLCGEDMLEKKPDGGNIVILESDTQNSIIERVSGFESTLTDSGIPYEIIDRANTSGDFNIALKDMQTIFEQREDIDVIFCGNDQIAVAAIAALNVAATSNPSLNDVLIYSVDGSPDIKKELQKTENRVAGTVAQFPIHMGQTAFDIALAIKEGDEFDTVTLEDVMMINSENLSMFGVDGWQ